MRSGALLALAAGACIITVVDASKGIVFVTLFPEVAFKAVNGIGP